MQSHETIVEMKNTLEPLSQILGLYGTDTESQMAWDVNTTLDVLDWVTGKKSTEDLLSILNVEDIEATAKNILDRTSPEERKRISDNLGTLVNFFFNQRN